MGKVYFLAIVLIFINFRLGFTQNLGGGVISGSLQTNINFFMKDSSINAFGTPQYEKQLYSADSWMNLNYRKETFSAGIRLDVFNNSYLLNPNGGSYTAIGIGNWFINKDIGKLSLSGGYIYDQIGSGIIYRAYEERPLAIDNALFGVKAEYKINDNWKIKGFTGKQKAQLSTYDAIVRGASIEGFIEPKEDEKKGKWSLLPGVGVVARTLGDESVDNLTNILKNYDDRDRIDSYKSNTYAYTVYNTTNFGNFSWYVEGALKSPDVMYAPFEYQHLGQDSSIGKFINKNGHVLYSSLSTTFGRLGITLEGKRTENFSFRTDPNLQFNRGLVNYIPALTKINTYRLTSRYNAATQFMGELAFQADVQYAFNDNVAMGVNFSYIDDLENEPLYRELYIDLTWKPNINNAFLFGVQRQIYNQYVYEGKAGVPNVETIVPFGEFLHKFSKKKSLRVEASAMLTDQDYGSWLYGVVEYSVAPHWSFNLTDMYNFKHNPEKTKKANNYPSMNVIYNQNSNRFSLGYIKQVEGIVCTGGVCRYEPAFSGFRFSLSSTF